MTQQTFRLPASGVRPSLFVRRQPLAHAPAVLYVHVACYLDLGEVAAHGHHAEVLCGKLHLRVHRVDLPGHGTCLLSWWV